jgi:hypothetical protein
MLHCHRRDRSPHRLVIDLDPQKSAEKSILRERKTKTDDPIIGTACRASSTACSKGARWSRAGLIDTSPTIDRTTIPVAAKADLTSPTRTSVLTCRRSMTLTILKATQGEPIVVVINGGSDAKARRPSS